MCKKSLLVTATACLFVCKAIQADILSPVKLPAGVVHQSEKIMFTNESKDGLDTIKYHGDIGFYGADENAVWTVRFTPSTACTLKSAIFGIHDPNGTGNACTLWVWDDASGMPGSIVEGPIVVSSPAAYPNWNDISIPGDHIFSADFHIGYWLPGGNADNPGTGPMVLMDAAPNVDDRSMVRIGATWYTGSHNWITGAAVSYAGEIHDIEVVGAYSSEGSFIPNPGDVEVSAVIKNGGDDSEVNFDVVCTVTKFGAPVFADTITVDALSPEETDSLIFTPSWQPTEDGEYIINVTSHLPDDGRPNNDTKEIEVHVVTYPCDLAYDDGSEDNAWAYYNAGDGWAQRFDGADYPLYIDSIKFHIGDTSWPDPGGDQMIAAIYDDDGTKGSPGTELFNSGTITITRGAWNTIPIVPTPIEVTDGRFYVTYLQVGDHPNCAGLSEDLNPPISGQSWGYVGGVWGIDGKEFMIRACVSGEVGIETSPVTIPDKTATLSCNPNPVRNSATISYGISRKTDIVLSVYDITGKRVRNLVNGVQSPGYKSIDWDSRNDNNREVPSGIYFLRLNSDKVSQTRKIIVLR